MPLTHLDPLEPRRLLTAYRPDLGWAAEGVFDDADDATFFQPLAAQSAGRVLVKKYANVGGRTPQSLLRLTKRGAIDPTFAGPLAVPDDGEIVALPSGRLLRADGPSAETNYGRVTVQRFGPDGTLDPRFGGPGGRVFEFATSPRPGTRVTGLYLSNFTETPEGVLFVHLRASLSRGPSIALIVKLDARGRVDRSFGGGGAVTIEDGQSNNLTLAVDRFGRLSYGRVVRYETLRVTRYDADGTPDATLNGSGTIDVPTNYSRNDFGADGGGLTYDLPHHFGRDGSIYYQDYHLGADGKIDFSGTRRRDPSGALDPAYGKRGWLRKQGRIDADGTVLALDPGRVLRRYDAAGQVDVSFGGPDGVEVGTRQSIYELAPLVVTRDALYGLGGNGSIAKLAPRDPILLDPAGVLRLSGTAAAGDRVLVQRNSRGLRVAVNDVASIVRGSVTAIVADLDERDNLFFSDLDVPTTVFGGNGNDTITTAGGRDVIDAAGGDATIRSGAERDAITFYGGKNYAIDMGTGGGEVSGQMQGGTIRLDAGRGRHRIAVKDFGDFGVTPPDRTGDAVLRLRGGVYGVSIEGAKADVEIDSPFSSDVRVEREARVIGGDGDDAITVRGASFVDGRGGNDAIRDLGPADPVGDTLFGGDGDDRIEADGFKNQLRGGLGADTLLGGRRDDTLYGDAGNDLLVGGKGNDRLFGGDGDDLLQSREGTGDGYFDAVDGGPGDDTADADARDLLTAIENRS
jgi:Ca2+-binding RTX toxin-like protein